MSEVEDNQPTAHPYFIVDPFDVNHNPGKQIKFKGRGSTLYEEYRQFFKEIEKRISNGRVLEGVIETQVAGLTM